MAATVYIRIYTCTYTYIHICIHLHTHLYPYTIYIYIPMHSYDCQVLALNVDCGSLFINASGPWIPMLILVFFYTGSISLIATILPLCLCIYNDSVKQQWMSFLCDSWSLFLIFRQYFTNLILLKGSNKYTISAMYFWCFFHATLANIF